MRFKFSPLLIYICCFSYILAAAQDAISHLEPHLKLSKTKHFTQSDFNGDSQFWSMCRDKEGVYYFGNNDGALVYNGETWQKVTLPNSSSVRSIIYTSKQKIYAGGYNEIGVIDKDMYGNYHYKSILPELPLDNKNLKNIWQIHELDDTIIFRTFKGLIALTNTSSTYIPSANTFTYANVVNTIYYVQDHKLGVMAFNPKTKQLYTVFTPNSFNKEKIVAFLPSNQPKIIDIITDKGHIYKGNIHTKTIEKWATVFTDNQNESIAVALQTPEDYILGTIGSKVLAFSKTEKVTKTPIAFDAIQDATVLNLFKDQDNLWVLLNNGLDYITYNPISSQLFNKASVYDVLVKGDRMYLATNKGVYHTTTTATKNRLDFSRLDTPQGQTWSISNFNNSILISHDKGLFQLEGLKAKQIGEQTGFWKVIPLPNTANGYLACSYNGLYFLEYRNASFHLVKKIDGFDESTRDILPANAPNTFWVCHGYKGIYKIKLDANYDRVYAIDHFTDQNGLTSQFNINVHRWNSEIVFTTNTGVYTYNENKNRFVLHPKLNRILDPKLNTRKIIQDSTNTWVVLDNKIGYFESAATPPHIRTDIFLNVKNKLNRSLEVIVPLPEHKVLVGAKTGLYIYNLEQPKQDSAYTVVTHATRKEKATQHVFPIHTRSQTDNAVKIENTTDAVAFHFAAPKLNPDNNIQYSCQLKNLDKKWSPWSTTPYKEYNHLRPGNYTFSVKSMDLNGNTGKAANYHFTISPKWYETPLAITLYILFAGLLFGMTYRLISRKIASEKRKTIIASEKSKRLLELEIQQLKLQQDKSLLEESMLVKSKELTNYTMQLINKKKAFNDIQEDLKELKTLIKSSGPKRKLLDIFKKFHQHKIGEEYMAIYDVNFESIHRNFFDKLLAINPKLSKRELRLCAFIKMNLSNKEIAPLLSISVRGVETARYRVRKKLNIDQDSRFLDVLVHL